MGSAPEQAPATSLGSAQGEEMTQAITDAGVRRMAVPAVRDPGLVNDAPISDDDVADMRLESQQAAEPPETDEVPVADGPAQEQRPEVPQGNSDTSVSVLGADSALNVIVRGTFFQDGNSSLHEMVENTAAEFGMKVSGLRLNGIDAKSPTAASGDPNGSRTR